MTAKVYKAKDFMSKYVLSVPADCTVQELIHLFVSHPIDAIPVTDGDNKLLGIVSEGDLLYKKVRPYVPQYVDVLGASLYLWMYWAPAFTIADMAVMKSLSVNYWQPERMKS